MKLVPATGYLIAKPRLLVKKERTDIIGLDNVHDNGELVFQVAAAADESYLGKLIISSSSIAPNELNVLGNVFPEDSIVAYIEPDETEEVVDLPTE